MQESDAPHQLSMIFVANYFQFSNLDLNFWSKMSTFCSLLLDFFILLLLFTQIIFTFIFGFTCLLWNSINWFSMLEMFNIFSHEKLGVDKAPLPIKRLKITCHGDTFKRALFENPDLVQKPLVGSSQRTST